MPEPDAGLAGLWQQIATDGLPVQGWINDGQDVELAYPESVDAAPAAAPAR